MENSSRTDFFVCLVAHPENGGDGSASLMGLDFPPFSLLWLVWSEREETRRDRSLFKTWSEIRDWTKALVAIATAAAREAAIETATAIAAVDTQQRQKFLYQFLLNLALEAKKVSPGSTWKSGKIVLPKVSLPKYN